MESFTIKVNVLNRILELNVNESTTISDVKKLIQGRANIAFIKKKIVFSGNQLNDEMTLSQLGITNGSILEIENI